MAKAREAIAEIFKQKDKTRLPTVLCKYEKGTVSCIAHGYADPMHEKEFPQLYVKTVGVVPTLSVLLNRYSQKTEIGKVAKLELADIQNAGDENCYVAVCGYKPSCADFGMAYRNTVRFVLTLGGECWRVTQNSKPEARVQLTKEEKKLGEAILGANWDANAKPVDFPLKPDDLYGYDWFERFLAPDAEKLTVPSWYQEDLTDEMKKLGISGAKPVWSGHPNVRRDSDLWWTLVTLYTNLAWGAQLPCYRSGIPQPDFQAHSNGSVEEQKQAHQKHMQYLNETYGTFLDGLNVSGLLLDPHLKPVAWAVNTNKINKTQHAETALVLAWLKGNPGQASFEGYTFLSPWRSCCMCSGWIADVFKGCNVIWFIDDPGLPIRHLDDEKIGGGKKVAGTQKNDAGETFLPLKLEKGSKDLQELLKEYPWFHEFGTATYWDYNKDYLKLLAEFVDGDDKKKPGPVGLFKSEKYFNRLTDSWDSARALSTRVVQLLHKNKELQSYVNNVWALRRCIMAFDAEPKK